MDWGQRKDPFPQAPVISAATADPAAGADAAAVTVPAGRKWLLLTTYYIVVTDANVANRYWRLTVDDGTNDTFVYLAPTAITASITRNISTGHLVDDYSGALQYWKISLPTFELPATWNFQIELVSIQATDNIAAVRYTYKDVPT